MTYTLRDSPFFRLRSRKKLAELLNVSTSTLHEISARDDLYVRRWKHKKEEKWLRKEPTAEISQTYRPIDIPDPKLKTIQARIGGLLSRVDAPDWLFSPVKGRSYVDNAARHKGAAAFWLLDIADYFPSCTSANVAHFFLAKLECSPDVTAILVRLTTLGGCLPQGSPCSPILAYFSNFEMWAEIASIVSKAGLDHSVYADDITISGPLIRKEVIWAIKRTIHKHGLKLKAGKEQSLIHRPADITGVIVVGGATKLPNRQHQKLAELREERSNATSKSLQKSLDRRIAGRLAQRRQVEGPTGPR